MKIDAFTHFLPARYAERFNTLGSTPAANNIRKRVAGVPAIADLELRFRQLEEFGDDYRQIISIPAPPLEDIGDAKLSTELAQLANDGMAELVERHPEHFAGFVASLPLNDLDATAAEIDRACGELGGLGVQIFTNVSGAPWDEARFAPFWDKIAEVDKMIWAHPNRNQTFADYATEQTSKYEIWWVFGWPYETSAFMGRLVLSGLFDRHPGLRILTHHGGGMTPHFAGRVGSGWDQLGARTPDDQRADVETTIERRPIDYMRENFYGDTALMDAPHAIQCAIEFFGVEHILFASDSPFDPEKGPGYIRATIKNLEQDLDLSDEDLAKIFEGNARRLLDLSAAVS